MPTSVSLQVSGERTHICSQWPVGCVGQCACGQANEITRTADVGNTGGTVGQSGECVAGVDRCVTGSVLHKVTHRIADEKKLPFMAMLRNLRNLIKTGVSDAHHKLVLRRLRDERQVIQSRQFPFRFFAAYQVLEELRTNLVKHAEANEQLASMNTSSATAPSSVRVPASKGRGRVSAKVKAEAQKAKAVMRTLNR